MSSKSSRSGASGTGRGIQLPGSGVGVPAPPPRGCAETAEAARINANKTSVQRSTRGIGRSFACSFIRNRLPESRKPRMDTSPPELHSLLNDERAVLIEQFAVDVDGAVGAHVADH